MIFRPVDATTGVPSSRGDATKWGIDPQRWISFDGITEEKTKLEKTVASMEHQ